MTKPAEGPEAKETPARPYSTVSQISRTLLEERRSLFWGEAFPVTTEEEALARLEEVRQRERDATHHCYAYVVGGATGAYYQRYSDAGEPKGTAGKPILDAVLGRKLTDVLVVVTRYFGGVLLGAGGLVRAYSKSASMALEAAEPCTMKPQWAYAFSLPYAAGDTMRHMLGLKGMDLLHITYAEQLRFEVSVTQEQVGELETMLAEATAGRGRLERIGLQYVRREYAK